MDTVIDSIKLVNAMTASIIFGLLVFRGRRNYAAYNQREKVFHNGFLFYAFAAAFASIETYAAATGDIFTPFIILCANAYAVRAVYSYHHEIFGDKYPGV